MLTFLSRTERTTISIDLRHRSNRGKGTAGKVLHPRNVFFMCLTLLSEFYALPATQDHRKTSRMHTIDEDFFINNDGSASR